MATTKSTKKAAPQPSTSDKKSVSAAKPTAKTATTKQVGTTVAAAAQKSPAKSAAKPTAEKTVVKKSAKPAIPQAEVQAAAPVATPASGSKWEEIKQLLLGMKEQTLQEIKRSIKKGSESSVGEEPTGDIYDQASSERDRELGLLLNDREREKLHNIDEALLRITEGEYGICEECDEDIPLGRLKVLPFTRHCVKCKSDLEKLQAQTRRIEEDRAYREIPVGDDDEG